MKEPQESPGSTINLINLTINWLVKTNANCISSYKFIRKEFEEITSSIKILQNQIVLQDLKLCVDYNFSVQTISKENKIGVPVHLPFKKFGVNDPPVLNEPITSPCTNCKTDWKINGNNCPLDTLLITCRIESTQEPSECKSNDPTVYNLTGYKEGNFTVTLTSLSAWTNYSCTAVVNNTEGLSSNESNPFSFETNEKEPMKPEIKNITINNESKYNNFRGQRKCCLCCEYILIFIFTFKLRHCNNLSMNIIPV